MLSRNGRGSSDCRWGPRELDWPRLIGVIGSTPVVISVISTVEIAIAAKKKLDDVKQRLVEPLQGVKGVVLEGQEVVYDAAEVAHAVSGLGRASRARAGAPAKRGRTGKAKESSVKRTTIAFRVGYVLGRRADPERYEDLRQLAAHLLNSTVVQKLLLKLKDFLMSLVAALTGREPLVVTPGGRGR